MFAALVLLTGCDKSEAEMSPTAARFVTGIDGQVSRASGTAFAVDDRVGISCQSGSVVYTNREYKATSSTRIVAVSAPDSIYFNNDKDVVFTAYYPFAGTAGTAPGTVRVTTDGTAQEGDNQARVDFLHATATGSKSDPGVELLFTHRMSQVALTIKAGDGVSSLSGMTGFKITGLKLEGTFDPSTGTAVVTSPAAAPLEVSRTAARGATSVESTLIVFPQVVSGVEFEMTLPDAGQGDTQTYSGTMDFPGDALSASTSYAFVVTVSKTGLTVSRASIGQWTPGGTRDMTAK